MKPHPPTPHPDKENAILNARSLLRRVPPSTTPPRPHPQKQPPRPPSTLPATTVLPKLRDVARILEDCHDKSDWLQRQGPSLLVPLLQVAVKHQPLRSHAANLLASLSADPGAASRLAADPYLPVLDGLLAPPQSITTTHVAARATRNITAHSQTLAHTVARNSAVVHNLVEALRASNDEPDSNTAESAAALANFARCGLQCQAYAKKHGAISALVDAAMTPGDATRFHSCRALAEYSLEPNWLVLLISEGCVAVMIRVLEHDADQEIVSEATRFLGNLATSKVGREAVFGSGAVERIVARVLTLSSHRQLFDLRSDLLRTTANVCVSNKDAASRVISLGGLEAFIDAYGVLNAPHVATEAFRGLLIIAQASHATRAAVLREVGIKIRHDASHGKCVAQLYDLSRRIKIEASAERQDDFPQTIADLGARSKSFLFRAGPLAAVEEPSSTNVNSVPGLKSPDGIAYRQSGRLLSVQRPILHRERLERERLERPIHSPQREKPVDAPNQRLVHQSAPNARSSDDSHLPTAAERFGHKSEQGTFSEPPSSGSELISPHPGQIAHIDDIPRCRVLEKTDRREEETRNWVKAVWSAVCQVVSGPGNALPASLLSTGSSGNNERDVGTFSDGNGELQEDVYEIGVVLGRGGFATVFLAKNLRTGELVAVKRFHPCDASSPDANKKAELALRRAIKEQRIWDGLAHKNVVSYRGCFFGEKGELNLVAEYIPGWSLADHLSQIAKFPEHMVAGITLQIVAGLDYLHKHGVTHRDVKPANILVNPDGVIKITDFGVSSSADVPTMTGNTLVGTPWYIAPEMIEGRPYGKSVDIWSLGCTVIELATGKRPFHSLRPHIAMFRMTQDRMPPIPKKLSPLLRDFLKTCWVWDPSQRPTPAHLRRHPFLASVSKPEVANLKNMTRRL